MTNKSTTPASAQGAKTGTNGKNEKSNLGVAPTGEIKPTAMEEKPQPPKLEAPKPPTVEEIVKRVEFLQTKISTRDTISKHIDQVSNLKFGEFEDKDLLIIQSGKGESYTIKSPLLLTQVKTILIDSLQKQKEAVEAEINF